VLKKLQDGYNTETETGHLLAQLHDQKKKKKKKKKMMMMMMICTFYFI
jgi:hypothetical protein